MNDNVVPVVIYRIVILDHQGEWFNGKTAAFKVADLGSNPCSPANMK